MHESTVLKRLNFFLEAEDDTVGYVTDITCNMSDSKTDIHQQKYHIQKYVLNVECALVFPLLKKKVQT